jgi:hypothetical protein
MFVAGIEEPQRLFVAGLSLGLKNSEALSRSGLRCSAFATIRIEIKNKDYLAPS